MTQSVQAILPTIDAEFWESLNAIPTLSEIEATVFSLGPDRAPGPDGVNARFVQTLWPKIKSCVLKEVNTSFTTSIMPNKISISNMILIPKKECPQRVSDYRPISICNIIYKVISKILSKG